MADTQLTAVLVLTIAAMLVWFWRVFSELYRLRHIDRVFTRAAESLIPAFQELGASADLMAASMIELGNTMRAWVKIAVAELSPKQREIYDELRSIGVLPVDAIHEACARWPD